MAVAAYTNPRSVIVDPPSAVTFPPSVAPVAVMLATVGLVTVGANEVDVAPSSWPASSLILACIFPVG